MGLKCNDRYAYKSKVEEIVDTERQREGHRKAGRDWSHASKAKECLDPPEAGRDREGVSWSFWRKLT